MTIGTSTAAITSVYIASTSDGGPESQIPAGSTFYVIVNAEVGDTIWGFNSDGHIRVILQDLSTLTTVSMHTTNPLLIKTHDSFVKAEKDQSFAFQVAVPATLDAVYKPLAVMAIGAVDAIVSVLEGDLTVVEQS